MQDSNGYNPNWLKMTLELTGDVFTGYEGVSLLTTPLAPLGVLITIHAVSDGLGVLNPNLNFEKNAAERVLGKKKVDKYYSYYDIGINTFGIGLSGLEIARGGLEVVDSYKIENVGKYASATVLSKSISRGKSIYQALSNGLSIYSTKSDLN